MAKSELHFLGHIIDLTTVETDYNKLFNTYSGMPVLYNEGGLLRFGFDLGENFRFLERITTVNYELYKLGYPVDDGKIIFYDANDDILKTWKFKDAPIVYYKVKFDPNGIGMQVEMILSPAIQDYGYKIHRSWHVSPINQEPYQSPVHTTEQEEKTDLKFIASFERLGTYKGEFGFDWMRENYKDICQDYEKLKKEYFPTSIHEEEYFVPSLSMFPNQENVKLKLAIKKKEGTINDTDIIKLPTKKGIRFEPNEVKVSEADGKQITIICESPSSSDVMINLLDKDDKTVGKLNIFKNDEEYLLPIQFVKVLGDEENNTYNERTFAQLAPPAFDNIKKDLKNKYFNQALIKPDILPVKELVINTDSFAEKNLLTLKFNQDGTRGIPNYKKGFDDELYNEFIRKWGEFRGIIVFLSAIQQSGMESGHAKPYPRDNNYIMIVPMSITNSLAISHEVAHTLGLYHAWSSSELHKDRVLVIEDKQKEVKEWLNKYKEYPDNTKIGNTSETLSQRRQEYNDWLENLEKEKNDKIELSTPLYAFNRASTENIMDYNGYRTTSGEIIYNPFSEGITFWQWQWKMMINEVKKYHGK